MKNLLLGVCLVIILSKYVDTRDLLLQALRIVETQLQSMDGADSREGAARPALAQAGQERWLAARVLETLRRWTEAGELEGARIELQQVQFVRLRERQRMQRNRLVQSAAPETSEAPGYYVVTLSYDFMQPLSRTADSALITAICETGAGQVTLDNGASLKSFRCQTSR